MQLVIEAVWIHGQQSTRRQFSIPNSVSRYNRDVSPFSVGDGGSLSADDRSRHNSVVSYCTGAGMDELSPDFSHQFKKRIYTGTLVALSFNCRHDLFIGFRSVLSLLDDCKLIPATS